MNDETYEFFAIYAYNKCSAAVTKNGVEPYAYRHGKLSKIYF